MDKQTAIDLLDNLLGMIEDNHGSDYDKAIHMGIDALKMQLSIESTTFPVDGEPLDCISRQQAILCIERNAYRSDDINETEKAILWVLDIIKWLPSAQPEQIARDIATIIENEQDMRVILKNERTETHSCDYQRTVTHDLVSRQSAIDSVCEVCENCEYFKNEKLIQTIKDLPSVQPQRWIPVPGTLPPSGEPVNVSCHDDSGDTAFDYTSCGWITTNGEYWIVDNEINSFVVAWMPLPKPWKGEKHEL